MTIDATTFHLDPDNGNDANDGSNWANAWRTITDGATAARITPGDFIKIAKSPDPVSIGTCQWNDLSKTVTRTGSPPVGSETLLIDDCESGWSNDNSSTVTHPTTVRKSGSASFNITKGSYSALTLYAHKTLDSTLDLSGFTAITGWLNADAVIADTDRWVICLCSDTIGLTVVDSFAVQSVPTSGVNRRTPFRYERVGGGALGASIASIAVYTGTMPPANGQDLGLDNINACNDFSLLSFITKASTPGYDAEGIYPIQSINGTTVMIDNDTNTLADAGRGYSGTTEEVTTYRRETFKVPYTTTGTVSAIQAGGSDGNPITFSGGWNTSTDLQDGISLIDGVFGGATGLGSSVAPRWLTITDLGIVRYSTGINLSTGTDFVNFSRAYSVGHTSSSVQFSANSCDITDMWLGNSNYGGFLPRLSDITRLTSNNHNNRGIDASSTSRHIDCVVRNNGSIGVNSSINAINLTLSDNVSPLTVSSGTKSILVDTNIAPSDISYIVYGSSFVYLPNYLGSGYDYQFTDGGTIFQSATDFGAPATGKMWTLLTDTDGRRTNSYPLKLRLSGIAVVANKLVALSVRMRKAHATNVNGRFVLPGRQIAGVDANVVSTLANSTDEQTLTITFTPTASGVVVPEVWAEYVAGHAAVCVDRFVTIYQAP